MKKVYLIRHAKSDWKKSVEDFQRPLNKRGKKDAELMANRLKNFDIKPDVIYSSPAKRAKSTAKIMAKILNYPKDEIIYKKELYESSLEDYLNLIKSIGDNFQNLFIIGHNPTITEAGEYLSGTILTNMPTCSIVCIEFETDSFADIRQGKLSFFDYPKKHRRS